MKIFLTIAAVVVISSTALYAQTKKPVSTTLPGIQKKPQTKPSTIPTAKTNEKASRAGSTTASTGGASAYGNWTPAYGFPKILVRVKRGSTGINSATKKQSTLWYVDFKNTDSRYTTFRWKGFGTDAEMREYFTPNLVETTGGADDRAFKAGDVQAGDTFSVPGGPTKSILIAVYRVTYNEDYHHYSKREDGGLCNYCIAKPEDPYCPDSKNAKPAGPSYTERREALFRKIIDNLKQSIVTEPVNELRWRTGRYRHQTSNLQLSIEDGDIIIRFKYTMQFLSGSDGIIEFSNDVAGEIFDFDRMPALSEIPKRNPEYFDYADDSLLTFDEIKLRLFKEQITNRVEKNMIGSESKYELFYRMSNGGANYQELIKLAKQTKNI